MDDISNLVTDYEVEFKYSESGTPYIDLYDPELGKLVFSKLTADKQKGYRYICWSRRYLDLVSVKKGDERGLFKVEVQDGAVFNIKMKRNSEGNKGVKQGTLPRPLVNWLIDAFDRVSPDGEHIPFNKIPVLEELVNKTNFNKIIKKPKKRVARKPKNRTAEKAKKGTAAKAKGV